MVADAADITYATATATRTTAAATGESLADALKKPGSSAKQPRGLCPQKENATVTVATKR